METEKYLSGYCRVLDDARMVEVVLEDGELMEADCRYGNCPHQNSCLIAKEIAALSCNSPRGGV